LEIIFGSIFNIYHSTLILCCTTGVGGGDANEQFWFGENLWKSGQNLRKPSEFFGQRSFAPPKFCPLLLLCAAPPQI